MVKRIIFVLNFGAAFLFAAALTALAGDIENHPGCLKCGMDRQAYGYSRALVEFADGTTEGFCSITCALSAIDRPDSKVGRILVADRDTRELVEAEKALWVIGGSKPGVMTMRAKWAFGTKAGAENFVRKYGGKTGSWQDALRAARMDANQMNRK